MAAGKKVLELQQVQLLLVRQPVEGVVALQAR